MAFERKADSGAGDSFKFEKVGDSITGVYVGAQDYPDGKFGPTTKHIFNTKGGVKIVWAKPDSQVASLLLGETGKLVRLTFERTKNTGKGNPLKIYTLDVDSSYAPTEAELAVDDDPELDDDVSADEVVTAPAKKAPVAASPTPAKRAQVNAFLNRGK